MSLLSQIIESETDLMDRHSTPPLQRRQTTVFEVDDEVELSQRELDWLDTAIAKGTAGAVEQAVNVCLTDYGSFMGLGDKDNARHQLRRARAVLQHFLQ